MLIDKSPSPDGMNPAFFQKYWHIVGSKVSSTCLSVLTHNIMPDGFNDTHIVLIPKKQHVESMGDLRPISLCNVIYKIVAKVLANRLRKVMPTVASHTHGAFIKERLITDNILISFEVLHFLTRKTQGKHGFAKLKVDMENAYDRVE